MCGVRLAMPVALLAALALAAPASAAPPLGAPEVVRVARPGDEHQHPRALTEWWQLVAVGPRATDSIRIRLSRGHRMGGVDVGARSLPWSDRLDQTLDTSRRRRLSATGSEGATTLRRVRRGWVLTMTGPLVSGRLTLKRALPGATGLRWRLGRELRWPRYVPVDMNWSALVATSRVSGRIMVNGTPLRLTGWRASLEHVWGRFEVDDEAWEFLNAFTIHRRDGAVLAFGLNRRDATTGSGARDAQWLGVLARVTRGRTRICRPTVDRRRWVVDGRWTPSALALRARCGRTRIAFRAAGSLPPLLWGDFGLGFFDIGRPATASGGGRGIAVVWGHDLLPF
jgi:hypothetical protein